MSGSELLRIVLKKTDLIVCLILLIFVSKTAVNYFSYKRWKDVFISSSGKTFDEMSMTELEAIHQLIWKKYRSLKGSFIKDISENQIALKEKLICIEDAMVKKEILEMNSSLSQ